MWAFRLKWHMRFVKSAYFVTLTYASGIKRTPNGFLTLHKKHFQNYMKRIRKELNDNKDTPFNHRVKYIVTGEYGGKRGRPHYHAILFNVPMDVIKKYWPYGLVDIREVNSSRIAYIFKYISKARKPKQTHDRDDRVPEYVNMSQGLGKQWLEDKRNVDFHRRFKERPYIVLENGQKMAIPRYYKERIFTPEERQQIADYMKTYGDDKPILTPEQDQLVLQRKKEKIRLMYKHSKREKNE